jgi:hypothetical protein
MEVGVVVLAISWATFTGTSFAIACYASSREAINSVIRIFIF